MRKIIGVFFLALGIVCSGSAFASSDVAKLSAQACEKINANEAKSTVRVRAADKANFFAVSRLASLKKARNTLDEHNFNVLVYNIVDEFVEDLNVKTTSQNDDEICVEIAGFVNNQNVLKAFDNYMSDDISLEQEEDAESIVANVNKVIPMPAIDEKKDEQKTEPLVKASVYVEPVEFYNNTASEKYADFIKKQFEESQYFSLTDDKKVANYIVKPKVLKIKADAINTDTFRLHMVLSLGVKGVAEKMEVTEFQNRFILFSKDENEQNVAKGLMQKLFKTAGQKIMDRIDGNERRKGNYLPEVITPVKSGLSFNNESDGAVIN